MTLSRLCRPLACLLTARRCVAAVEFALLAPIFVLMFAAIVDLGNALWTWCRLEEAVAAGTELRIGQRRRQQQLCNGERTVRISPADIAGIVANSAKVGSYLTPADVTVVVNNGPATTITNGVPANSGTPANADSYYCPTGSPPTWSWGSAYGTAGTACTGGGTSGKFVTVTASYNFTPFFASYAFVTNGLMTAGAVVQTK